MTAEKPARIGADSAVLTYIAQHPDATKYELARNVRMEAYPNGVPYATISLWIKSLEKRQEVVAKKLGPTRAGLTKTGYRITPSALFWISYALDTEQLLKLIQDYRSALPLSPSLTERAIRSTGDATGVIRAVTDLSIRDGKTDIDDYFTSLILNILMDLEFDDANIQQEFVSAIIQAAATVNASKIGRADFQSSLAELVESESRYLANATRTLDIVKNEAEVLSRS